VYNLYEEVAHALRPGRCQVETMHELLVEYVTRFDYNNMAVSLSDPEHLITPPYRHVSSYRTPRGSTYSAGGEVNHQSITPENAANAAPPPAIAMGPEFLAKIAPVTNPPDTAFVMSCFARYYP
jgi:hypothetical protein